MENVHRQELSGKIILSQHPLSVLPAQAGMFQDRRKIGALVNGKASEFLHGKLVYSGFLPEQTSYSSRLLACIEVSGQ